MGVIIWLLVTIFVLYCLLFIQALIYQATRKIPGPFVWPIFGSFFLFVYTFKGESPKFLKYYDKYFPGQTVEVFFLGYRTLWSNDPSVADYILNQNAKNWLSRMPIDDPSIPGRKLLGLYHQGLLSNDDIERWKFQRAIFLKGLRNDLLVHASHLASQKVAQAVRSLSAHQNSAGQIDANAFVRRIITDVVFLVAFGEDLNTAAGAPNETADLVRSYFDAWMYFSLTPVFVWKYLAKKKVRAYLEDFHKLQAIIDRVIQREKLFLKTQGKESIVKPNFIQLLLVASSEDSPNSEMKLSEGEVRQCALEMILGGTDTSVNVTANLMYAVAEHPDVERKICLEIQSFGLKEDEFPTSHQLSEMKYIEAVVKETLRLYPVIELATRCATDDDSINGLPIKKNTWILVRLFNQPHIHFAPDPDAFRPERFLEKTYPKESFLPFGSGPRNCVGQYLAMMEMKAVVFEIYRRLDLKMPQGKSMRDLKTSYSLIRHPAGPMWLDAKPK